MVPRPPRVRLDPAVGRLQGQARLPLPPLLVPRGPRLGRQPHVHQRDVAVQLRPHRRARRRVRVQHPEPRQVRLLLLVLGAAVVAPPAAVEGVEGVELLQGLAVAVDRVRVVLVRERLVAPLLQLEGGVVGAVVERYPLVRVPPVRRPLPLVEQRLVVVPARARSLELRGPDLGGAVDPLLGQRLLHVVVHGAGVVVSSSAQQPEPGVLVVPISPVIPPFPQEIEGCRLYLHLRHSADQALMLLMPGASSWTVSPGPSPAGGGEGDRVPISSRRFDPCDQAHISPHTSSAS
mmetsp:Transcript_16591/g.41939  ORF Transcript_16591/g.41939 Transcript_16591/m.41939 type:complete len:291 (-) Transcript_16591:118-990(-)